MQPTTIFVKVLLVVFCSLSFISLFSQTSTGEWKTRISKDIAAIGISADDASECTVSSSFTDISSNIQYVYIQQTYQQLRVFNNIITIAYKNGNIVYTSGRFINNIRRLNLSATPTVQAATALLTSARNLNLRAPTGLQILQDKFQAERKILFTSAGIAKREIETELMWVQDDSGSVHLAWNVNIDVAGSPDWWNVRVDARSGEVVNKDNWTVHEKKPGMQANDEPAKIEQHVMRNNPFASRSFVRAVSNSASLWSPPNVIDASYMVVPFPYDNRYLGPVAIEKNPWLKAGTGNAATTYGWHFDGTTNYTISRGNNVWAYDDSLHKDHPGMVATSTTPAPSLSFNFSPDFSKQPYDSINRSFNISNLFYWNNIVHDIAYQYGFDEAAGNFQAHNMGRGGSQGDLVQAEAQDGSGTNNASFTPAPDGNAGRLQMFLWSPPTVLSVLTPSQVAGDYLTVESDFNTKNKFSNTGPITGEVVFYDDPGGSTHLACDSTVAPLHPISGKVALIYRGTCDFTNKFHAAQKYGAIGVIVINNVPGSPGIMGPTDNTITIPGIMISQDDGAKIAAEAGNGLTIKMNTTGLYLDGDIDNGIITHEYGHGISTRLTGGRLNASCMNNAEQGGEGWSDYLALMLTTNWSTAQLEDGVKPRAMATYAFGQPASGSGIRRFPYSTDILVNSLTYANMAISPELHDIGEIWCSALWDMTWNIIQHEGRISSDIYNSSAEGGNVIALKLVIEGMKLQPCRPGFLNARDAILVADSILYNNRHKCDIWRAFARRGMGVSASQGSYNNATDQVAAYDVPTGVLLTRTAIPTSVSLNQQTTVAVTLTCQCVVPANGFTVTDTIPPGFSYINSTGGTLVGNVVKFSSIGFNNPLESRTLSTAFLATGAGCAMVKVVNDNRDTDTIGGFAPVRSGSIAWTTSSAHVYSGTQAWWAPDSTWFSNFSLTSAPFTVGNLSVLSFWHYFTTINELDGGKVEISTNGTNWIDARPYFLQNGYNAKISSQGIIEPNTFAFSGTSYGTGSTNNGQFIQSIVNLSAFSGQTIRIRFRFITNVSIFTIGQIYDGWFIDDILVTNGCGGINRIALTGGSVKTDSLNTPVFITPPESPLPLTLVSFSARQSGTGVVLRWQTSEESSMRDYKVERSDDEHTWRTLGSVIAGNRSGSYNYVDEHPSTGKHNYYRIRMTDNSGQFTFTVIRVILLYDNGIMSMSPNPARDQTVVYLSGRVAGSELQLIDMKGRVLQRHVLTENVSTYTLKTAGLQAGTYLVKMKLSSGVVTKKLLIGR